MIDHLGSEHTPLTVVFVDRENTARSLMAEALLRHRSYGRVRAFSAGVEPGDTLDPDAEGSLGAARVPTDDLGPKGIDAFANGDAPHVDFVISLSDALADDIHAAWPIGGRHLHWPMENPLNVNGRAAGERRVAFDHTRRKLETAIDRLIETAARDSHGPVG